VAFIVAAFSVIRKTPVTAAALGLGDMSIRRNIKPLRSSGEPIHYIII
jgi:ATP-dependent Lon protease